jgi:hypothetical protein
MRLTAGVEFLYHLHATGLPADRSYRLELRRIDGSVVRMPLGSVHYDASGVLVSRLGPLDAQPLSYGPVFKGEPLTQALVAEDGSGQVVARIVPVPIEAEGAGGCAARLELLDGTGQVFMLSARGFRPGEVVRMVSRSEGETLTSTPKASPAGEVTVVLAPAAVGKTGGSASVSLASRACTVTVPYRWGTAMERA